MSDVNNTNHEQKRSYRDQLVITPEQAKKFALSLMGIVISSEEELLQSLSNEEWKYPYRYPWLFKHLVQVSISAQQYKELLGDALTQRLIHAGDLVRDIKHSLRDPNNAIYRNKEYRGLFTPIKNEIGGVDTVLIDSKALLEKFQKDYNGEVDVFISSLIEEDEDKRFSDDLITDLFNLHLLYLLGLDEELKSLVNEDEIKCYPSPHRYKKQKEITILDANVTQYLDREALLSLAETGKYEYSNNIKRSKCTLTATPDSVSDFLHLKTGNVYGLKSIYNTLNTVMYEIIQNVKVGEYANFVIKNGQGYYVALPTEKLVYAHSQTANRKQEYREYTDKERLDYMNKGLHALTSFRLVETDKKGTKRGGTFLPAWFQENVKLNNTIYSTVWFIPCDLSSVADINDIFVSTNNGKSMRANSSLIDSDRPLKDPDIAIKSEITEQLKIAVDQFLKTKARTKKLKPEGFLYDKYYKAFLPTLPTEDKLSSSNKKRARNILEQVLKSRAKELENAEEIKEPVYLEAYSIRNKQSGGRNKGKYEAIQIILHRDKKKGLPNINLE